VFIRDWFETLAPQVFDFTGQNPPKIYLNWKLYRVTYVVAGTIIDNTWDSASGERVAEMGQIWFALETTDNSAGACSCTSPHIGCE
jgi:hypothetical protein